MWVNHPTRTSQFSFISIDSVPSYTDLLSRLRLEFRIDGYPTDDIQPDLLLLHDSIDVIVRLQVRTDIESTFLPNLGQY